MVCVVYKKYKDTITEASFNTHCRYGQGRASSQTEAIDKSRELPITAQLHSSPASLYGRFTTVCLGKGFRPVSFPLLSALLGDMNGRLGPEQKADHGSIGGDK